MKRSRFFLLSTSIAVGATLALVSAARHTASARAEIPLEIASIHWEYNATANDLGVHVALDGEDWRQLSITNPDGKVLFQVKGGGPYASSA
jgi:hypothetical protein